MNQEKWKKLKKKLSDDDYNGCLCVMHEDEVLFELCAGYAVIEDKVPFTEHSTLELASLSKNITAVLIMVLAEHHMINIKDKIIKYLPLNKDTYQDITIENLLNHTSGIVDYTAELIIPRKFSSEQKRLGREINVTEQIQLINGLCHEYQLNDVIELINNEKLHFKTGTQTAYSNTNYYLLSRIAEKVCGLSFGEVLEAQLFRPLEMTSSHNNGLRSQCDCYIKTEDDKILNLKKHGMRTGDSGIVSNLKDLRLWCNAIQSTSIIDINNWNQCFHIVNNRYGFGFQKYSDGWLGHNGGMPGISTALRIEPKKKLSIIALSNCTNQRSMKVNDLMLNVIDIISENNN